MLKYPIFLDLSQKRVVVVGGGPIAARKALSLRTAGARVLIIAERIDDTFKAISQDSLIEIVESKYSKNYLVGAAIVIAATNSPQTNQQIYKDCQELEILCNIVDEPDLCDFFVPAVVKRGKLQIAIGTEGACPAYSGHIRKKLEELFTENHGRFLDELTCIRSRIQTEIADNDERKAVLGLLVDDDSFEYFVKNGSEKWHNYAESVINTHKKTELQNPA